MPSAVTLNTSPQGGARPGVPEVDDVASTLVWQKDGQPPPGIAGIAPGVATVSGIGGPRPGQAAAPGHAGHAGAPGTLRPPAPPGYGAAPAAPYGAAGQQAAGQPAGGPPAAPGAPHAQPQQGTLSGPHGGGQALPPGMVATRLAGTQVQAMANMMAATAVGMPAGFEEEMRKNPAPSANTLVGMAKGGEAASPPARAQGPAATAAPAGRTLVGVAHPSTGFAAQAVTARQLPADGGAAASPAAASPSATAGGGSTTLPARVLSGANAGPSSGPVPPSRASAPKSAASPAAAPRAARPGPELGATGTPALAQRKMPGLHDGPPSKRKQQLDKRVVVPVPGKKKQAANRTGIFAIAGGVAALVAVLVVVLWPGRGAIVAQPRVDAEGRDGLDIECKSCPDATAVRIGSVAANVVGQHAFLPISLPLGESKLEVVIDRPGDGKDEVAKVSVHIPYRVTTDLSTLRGERPSIQVVVEAQDGTQVSLDGKSIPLVNGRAIDMLDVSEACSGESEEPRTLSRKIPYTVTPPGRSAENGTLHVSVPITTLRITAPGAAIVTEKESFVLAGRTAKGVELFAGPHAIPLRTDGTFAHVMNVSAVGATQIAVRAQAQGMAPRIVKIDVRRVESLQGAAREFASRSPLSFPDLASDPKSKVGRFAMVSGLVLGSKSAEQITVLKLRGYGGPACPPLPPGTKAEAVGDPGPCAAEIAVGAQVPYGAGDLVTGCGRFAGTTGEPGAEVPQVRADFVVQGVL